MPLLFFILLCSFLLSALFPYSVCVCVLFLFGGQMFLFPNVQGDQPPWLELSS